MRGDTILPGYTKKMYILGFSKDVAKIDAAFYDRNKGKIYCFIGDRQILEVKLPVLLS